MTANLHTKTMLVRVSTDLHDKVKVLCQETGKNQSVVLREGLMVVLKNYQILKQERSLLSQF
jgi:hypothetical protein